MCIHHLKQKKGSGLSEIKNIPKTIYNNKDATFV